jgi:hypothetical protein
MRNDHVRNDLGQKAAGGSATFVHPPILASATPPH